MLCDDGGPRDPSLLQSVLRWQLDSAKSAVQRANEMFRVVARVLSRARAGEGDGRNLRSRSRRVVLRFQMKVDGGPGADHRGGAKSCFGWGGPCASSLDSTSVRERNGRRQGEEAQCGAPQAAAQSFSVSLERPLSVSRIENPIHPPASARSPLSSLDRIFVPCHFGRRMKSNACQARTCLLSWADDEHWV